MLKFLRIALSLLLVSVLLPACKKKQDPSNPDTMMAPPTASRDIGDGIIPPGSEFGDSGADSGLMDDFGLGAEGLQARGASDGIGGGMYNGRQMVTGILEPVFFDFDASSIASSERTKLQAAATYLRENPSDGLLIEGHCDWYGTAEYNLALGDRRASSARDFLITLGISSGRIDTLSKGSLEATPGLPKSQSREDRRADLIILR